MSEETTDRLALPLLSAAQAQKEIFHNEALTRIDMLVHAVAVSADIAVPPGDPVAGQCWIVAAGASGAWSGRAAMLAGWTNGGWRYCAAVVGMRVHVADRGHAMLYGSDGWHDVPDRRDGYVVAGLQVVGARQPGIAVPVGGAVIDAEGRATVAAILGAMRAHGLIAA